MLSVIPGQDIPEKKFSKLFIQCRCSCGNPNIISIRYLSFTRGDVTCGKCVIFKWKLSGIRNYGRLELITDLDQINKVTDIVRWKCQCGGEKKSTIFRVMRGVTKSCGCAYSDKKTEIKRRTNEKKSFDEWKQEFPALLESEFTSEWTKGSRNICTFKCRCGKEFKNTFNNYKLGRKCGRCAFITLKNGTVFGKATYVGDDVDVSFQRTTRLKFRVNECGHEVERGAKYVGDGNSIHCFECKTIDPKDTLYGRLRFKDPKPYQKYSTERVDFICLCSGETKAIISNVLNGITKSCGDCRRIIAEWYKRNESEIRSLRCPFNRKDLPEGGMKFLDPVVEGSHKNIRVECFVCGEVYNPAWGWIRTGKSLTCGCASNRVSSGQRAVFSFIKNMGIETHLEYKVGGLKYDIGVPEKKMLIEFNGTYYHSGENSAARDKRKYENAIQNGWNMVTVLEEDWNKNRPVVENLLRNQLEASIQ